MAQATEFKPEIGFTYRAEVRSENNQHIIDLIIEIENLGRQMVRYPSIEIGRDRLFKLNEGGLDSRGRHGLALQPPSSDPTQTDYVFRGGENDIIYPGKKLEVTRLTAVVPAGPEAIQKTTLHYELHCEGFDASGEETIGLEETIMRNWRG